MAKQLRVADLFCGIGSFHIAAEALGMRCVYACDNDPHVQKVYQAHFGMLPDGDIQRVNPAKVPEMDILTAGFPCQPFSRMGNKRGTNEERGRVMDYAVDILRVKRPRAFILENVRGLLSSNEGEDFKRLEVMLRAAGYSFQYQLLKCEDFGIPQTRHRIFMVGFRDGKPADFRFPEPATGSTPSLSDYLGLPFEKPFSKTVRCSGRRSGVDNAKNWSAYRLTDGRIIELELEHVIKLQGFPTDFEWAGVPDGQKWKMLGNSIPTCMSRAMLEAVAKHLESAPEEEATPLPTVVHPPPSRKTIMRRLDHLTDMVNKDAVAKALEEVAPDGTEADEDSEEAPPSGGHKRSSPQDQSPLDADPERATPTNKRPRLLEDAQTMLQLTVKSGAQIILTLPPQLREEYVVLKVVR